MNVVAPETPMASAGPEDEQPADDGAPVFQIGDLPDLKTNFADDENVLKQVLEEVVPVVYWCKQQRKTLEEEWRAIRRMVLLEHDAGQRYMGRSNAYIPAYAKARSTLVSRVARGLFPSDQYMDVSVRGDADPEAARPVKDYIQYEFEKVAKIRSMIKPFLREFFDNGIAVGKVWYEPKELANRKVGKLKLDTLLGGSTPTLTDDSAYEGLRFRATPIFNWYVYPFTVSKLEEATLVFEDVDVTRQYIREMGRKNIWINIEDALTANIDPDHNFNVQQLMVDTTGNSSTPASSPLAGKELGDVRTLREVYARLTLPKKAYGLGEDNEAPVMCKIVYTNNKVMMVRRLSEWHNEFPYVVARMEVTAGSFYPKGIGHLARSLQYLVNDFTNQLNDNGSYAMNPVAKVNPAVLAGPLPPLKPGAVWPMTDTEHGAVFDRPPVEQLQYGQQLVATYNGMLQDFTGAPPVLQGSSAGKGAKTATGAQILQSNAQSPLQDLVEDLEADVMVPLMRMAWLLGQQYRQGTIMDEIGGAPIKVSREQLIGDYTFRWLASSQAANQQQRAQQGIMLLQAVQPIVPLLVQLGYVVDPTILLKRIYADGFGWRGFDQFIRKLPPQPVPGGQLIGPDGQPAQAPPMQPQSSQDIGNVRSALEQVHGGGNVEMQPGEGEEFANVRDNADQLAAFNGGSNR